MVSRKMLYITGKKESVKVGCKFMDISVNVATFMDFFNEGSSKWRIEDRPGYQALKGSFLFDFRISELENQLKN